jgi:polyisoprenoid-binding protein YceI
VTAGPSTSIETTPAAATYRIDPERSTVSYTGRHMVGLGVVHAAFTIESGKIVVAEPLTASTVSVSVNAASFASNSAKRDRDVRAAGLLDVANYPHITFTSERVRDDAGDHWSVAGTVTAHNTSAPVEVIVDRVSPEADGLRIHARSTHLDRQSFGITKGKGMVGRYLNLDLDVMAVPV